MRESSTGDAVARMNRKIAIALHHATPGHAMTELTHIWLGLNSDEDKDAFALAIIGTVGGFLGKATIR